MKRVLACILSIAVVVTMTPAMAFMGHMEAHAAGDAVASIGGTEYSDLHTALEDGKTSGTAVKLLKDVTLTGEWTPVSGFSGTLDGDGHTISGLKISSGGENIGLFASTSRASIKDLTIAGAEISGEGMTGANVGVLAGSLGVSTVDNVKITGATVKTTAQYVGGIAGNSSSTIKNCTVSGSKITGKDQVGGLSGYQWCNGIWSSTASNNTVKATEERAGGLAGKIQISDGNDSNFKFDDNTVSGGSATAPDFAGGIAAQLMGDFAGYTIKNNKINNLTLKAPKMSPVGTIRNGQNETFLSALTTNVTGNTWTAIPDGATIVDEYGPEGNKVPVYSVSEAKIGDTKYDSLADAVVGAKNGDTVVLLNDITITEKIKVDSKSIDINLNGHTITQTEEGDGTYGIVYDGYDASVDHSVRTSGKVYNGTIVTTKCGIYAADHTDVEVENVTVKQEKNSGTALTFSHTPLAASYGATLTVKSGTFTGDYAASIFTTGGKIIINGGTLIGRTDAFYVYEPSSEEAESDSSVVVNGGKISGNYFVSTAKGYGEYKAEMISRGGMYSVNPIAYVADGYSVASSGDQEYPYEVKEATPSEEPEETIVVEKTEETSVSEAIIDSAEKQAAEEALESTDVSGVSEALEDNKDEFVADVLKDTTKAGELTQEVVESAKSVDIAITVEVVAKEAKTTTEEATEKILTFELTPYAVITATAVDGTSVSSESVEVSNSYLAKSTDAAIKVQLGSAFEPKQVVHVREDGVNEVFTKGNSASFEDKTFECTEDNGAYLISVEILQFSELKLLGASQYSSVVFDAKGGTGSQESLCVDIGGEITLPECTLTPPEGKVFAGWQVGTDIYQAGDKVKATDEAITIAAVWKDISYKVTFDNQDHGAAVPTQEVVKGEKITKPADPSEEGYNFGGWYIDKECTKAWDFDKDTVTADVTLYAKWTQETNLTDCMITVGDLAFNNKVQTPEIHIVDSIGKELVEGTDYTAEKTDSIKVGTYEINLVGIGEYTGTITKTYKINPAAKSISTVNSGKKKLVVKWKKSSKAYLAQTSGYQIKYSTSKSFRPCKTVNASRNSMSKSIYKLKGHKKYYVKMRAYKTVNGKRYYSAWSSTFEKKTR